MALQKAYNSAHGVSGDYWMIADLSWNKIHKVVSFSLFQFVDKANRDAGSVPLDIKSYTIGGDEYDTFFSAVALAPANRDIAERSFEFLKDDTTTAKNQNTDVDFTTEAIDDR